MKTIAIIIFITGFSTVMLAGTIIEKSGITENNLLLIKSKGDILLYENTDIGNNTKYYIATFKFEVPVAEMVSLLKDEEFAISWIKSTNEYSDISITDKNWYSYIRFAPPWPINQQDCILQFTLAEYYPSHATILFRNIPGYVPVKEKVTRIKEFEGRWEIEMLNDSTSRVNFIMYSNRFTSNEIKKFFILNTIVNSLKIFKEKASLKMQENAH